MKDMKISELGLSERPLNAIYKTEKWNGEGGFNTVGDLIEESYLGLLKIPGFGKECMKELISALRRIAYSKNILPVENLTDHQFFLRLTLRLEDIEREITAIPAKNWREMHADLTDRIQVLENQTHNLQAAKLDGFAKADLTGWLASLSETETALLANLIYNIAEAMQAESRKRHGGKA